MPGENLTRIEAQQRRTVVDSHSYEVSLDLTRGDEVFGSRTVVRFTAIEDAETFIDLISGNVRSITLNGRDIPVSAHVDSRIALTGLERENELVVDADCSYTNTGEGLHRFVDPVDNAVYCFTQFETADARRMYACFEQPDLKASFDLTVLAPSDWTVLSNSPAVRPVTVAESVSKWDFAPTPPISSYITALVPGGFHTVAEDYQGRGGTVPLTLAGRASLVPYLDADRLFATTRGGFDVFEEAFGRP